MKLKNLNVQPTALLAELVGTFILVVVAITVANPIIVGFTMLILVIAIGAVSGAHVNPAVTFGLWASRKLDGIKVPFYWIMQFTGAIAALFVAQWFQGNGLGVSFGSFGSFEPKIFVAEILGTAVFTFTVAAAVSRKDLTESAKALGVGLGLLAGLAVGGGLLGAASQSATPAATASRISRVDGVTVNPAVALASTEKEAQTSLQSLTGQAAPAKSTKPVSRLTWETLVGTLLGGAIGTTLYVVTTGANPFVAEKKSVGATVTAVFKKGEKKAKKVVKKGKK